MSSRVSPDGAFINHRTSVTFPAIQTQKDNLKDQLSRIFEGPELREHRVCYFAVYSHNEAAYGWFHIVRSQGRLHAQWFVWTRRPLLICKRQWHLVEDSRLGCH